MHSVKPPKLHPRPNYTKREKEGNAALAAAMMVDIGRVAVIHKRTDVHWTLHFRNGRRREFYPTTMGLHNVDKNSGSKLAYYTPENMRLELIRVAQLPDLQHDKVAGQRPPRVQLHCTGGPRPDPDDDFDVLED